MNKKPINFYLSKNFRTGGNLYNYTIIDNLKDKFNFNVIKPIKYNGKGRTYLQLLKSNIFDKLNSKHLNILDQRYTAFRFRNVANNLITIFHHFDINEHQHKNLKHKILFNNSLRVMKQSNLVITVSKFWEIYLKDNYGINNIKTIYNSIDPKFYKPSISKDDFFKKHKLDLKPILFIGKNVASKTLFAYNKIRHLENKYNIITTGERIEFRGPINLNLDYKDYVNLLNYSDIAILLTRFKEGWNRIAHEALICNTPVIGLKDSGGMEELLGLTQQRILDLSEIDFLEEIIIEVLDKSKVDNTNLLKFNLTYFSNEWEKIVNQFSL